MESSMGWLVLVCLHLLFFHFPFFHSLCLPAQTSALLKFKTSVTVNTTYYSECEGAYPKTETWENGTDCCSWLGVTCHPISGHVTGLDLSCSILEGKIHPNNSLFRLSHLQSLNLAFNDFSQSHLSSHFGEFASLTHLNLSNTNFEGEIPSTISHLSKLTSLDLSLPSLKWKESTWKRLLQNATGLRELVLDETDMSSIRIRTFNMSSSLVTLSLSDTGLKGNLTSDILCLPNLQHLYLSDNRHVEVQLPNISCRATSLSILDLSKCQFQGSIPPFFSNLTHLTSLDLSYNHLNGSIPSSLLTLLPQLSFLDLSHNQLNGQIPDVFHQLNTFQIISLGYNKIGGELPLSLSNLRQLISLNLAENDFKGQIPSSLFDLTHLSDLDCSYNKLEGPLPNKITRFSNLTELHLSGNLLNGTIPSWCLSLPSLMYLDLSNNQFTGPISAISSYSLNYLVLGSNKLQGNIPKSIFSLVNLTYLDLSSNNLTGPVHFFLFSKLQNLYSLSFSHNSQLSLNFNSNGNYSFSNLLVLKLSSLNLTEFPQLSGKFPSLLYLDLSNNKLNGRVPNWLHEMSSLSCLNLAQNLLASSLDQFSWNNQLMYVDLSFNLLAGHISSLICNATSLELLNLSHNKLTGIIPQCLSNLSSLYAIDVHMNKLYGTLPSTFSKHNLLSTLNLNGNQLEGPLPKSLSNCTDLEVLNIGNNQIEDTFPHWLETLPNLKVLILRANKMQGPVATLKTKHPFPSLIILDISSNNFNGPIPEAYIKSFEAMKNVIQDEVDNGLEYIEYTLPLIPDTQTERHIDSVTVTTKASSMTFKKIPTDFVHIDLSKNKFEGEIPQVIGELHALKGLNLSHNRLNGTIPRSMGNMTNLESLDLSSNMLTGRIPKELINLNYLEVLNLSQNRLVGEIPQGKQFNTFSNDSYEGNLGLCGLPLSIKCNNNHEQHSPPLPTLQHEEKFGFGWKPVAVGYGCGMVFGMGIGYCVLLIGKPQWLVRMVGGNPNRRVKRMTN